MNGRHYMDCEEFEYILELNDFFPLMPNLSLAIFLVCFLNFWESQPYVSHNRVSYRNKNVKVKISFRFHSNTILNSLRHSSFKKFSASVFLAFFFNVQ